MYLIISARYHMGHHQDNIIIDTAWTWVYNTITTTNNELTINNYKHTQNEYKKCEATHSIPMTCFMTKRTSILSTVFISAH